MDGVLREEEKRDLGRRLDNRERTDSGPSGPLRRGPYLGDRAADMI